MCSGRTPAQTTTKKHFMKVIRKKSEVFVVIVRLTELCENN